MEEGRRVKCLKGSIDRNIGAGEIGVIAGFARFSRYHPREVFVSFDSETRGGWFWENSVVRHEDESPVQTIFDLQNGYREVRAKND